MAIVFPELPLWQVRGCSSCLRSLPADDFRPNSNGRGYLGLSSRCRKCEALAAHRWRQENPEKYAKAKANWESANADMLKKRRADRYQRDREKSHEQHRAWICANGDRRRENKRKNYYLHHDQYRETTRRWRAETGLHRYYQMARKARKLHAPGECSRAAFDARWSYYGGRCWMCGGEALAMDHVIALARGGSNWPANLRPACVACNSRKRDRDWRQFIRE